MTSFDGRPAPVAVVIPTRRRPGAVVAAVRSAWAQTLPPTEVIVVVDGADDDTSERLKRLDRRGPLDVVELTPAGGAARARNVGVQRASADWIAFLDDDDEWMPEKLAVQVSLLTTPTTVVAGRVFAETTNGTYAWPRRLPAPAEPISDYLFVRRGWFHGEGFVQTSTLVASRRLLTRIPFDESRARHQDWDWLLRAAATSGFHLVIPGVPVAKLMTEQDRAAISGTEDWSDSLQWVTERRDLFTERSAAAFVLVNVVASAVEARAFAQIPGLFRHAFRTGKPRGHDVLVAVGLVLVPRRVRRQLRRWMSVR